MEDTIKQPSIIEITTYDYLIVLDIQKVEKEGTGFIIYLDGERRIINKNFFNFTSRFILTMCMLDKMLRGTKGITQINGQFI